MTPHSNKVVFEPSTCSDTPPSVPAISNPAVLAFENNVVARAVAGAITSWKYRIPAAPTNAMAIPRPS